MRHRAFIMLGTAASALGFAVQGIPLQVNAAVSPRYSLSQKQIYFDNRLIAAPYGFPHNGTTYMPIWYVMQMLQRLHFRSDWDRHTWNIIVPTGTQVNFSKLKPGVGPQAIAINGTVVERVAGIAYPDPYSHVTTVYMPVWYLMQALKRVGIDYAWNGKQWHMKPLGSQSVGGAVYSPPSSPPSVGGAVYSPPSSPPGNPSNNHPGPVGPIASGYLAYIGPESQPQHFTSETDAEKAIKGHSTGYVVNAATNTIVKQPANTYYVSSQGGWTSSLYGWQGTSAPSFAKRGSVYVACDVNPGHSPHNTKFYELSNSSGKFVGKFAGIFENPFRTADLGFPAPPSVTSQQIDAWFAQHGSPLQGLGNAFIQAQKTYGVNAAYLAAHAVLESGWGKSSIAQAKNNLFGYGAYDSNPGDDAGIFPSEDYAIRFQSWEVRNNYLDPKATNFYLAPTLDGMNQNYASDPNWASSIAILMSQFAQESQQSVSKFTQYKPSQAEPPAASTAEPHFPVVGAIGTVLANPYGNLPVYPDVATGTTQMYGGKLQLNSYGASVRRLQAALNRNGAALTIDGGFGPKTQSALQAFQSKNGLPATGVCDFRTWIALNPVPVITIAPGSKVNLNEMAQGMVGNIVAQWYHVTIGSTSGWIDSQFMALQNVYRVQPASGYTATVYGAGGSTATTDSVYGDVYGTGSADVIGQLHTGDYVVSINPTPNAFGRIPVQFVNLSTNRPVYGTVDRTVRLVKVIPPSSPKY